MTLCHKPGVVQSSLEGLRVQKDWKESKVGVRVRSDIKGQWFLMVYTWYTHVQWRLKSMTVVATTHRNGTHSLLTSAKLTKGYLVVGIYKRTRQEALALFIYYIYTWLLVHATTISIRPLSPCRYLMSITHLPCVYLKATMLPTCALTSYL